MRALARGLFLVKVDEPKTSGSQTPHNRAGESDESLLERYAQGDPQAFDAFFTRHQVRVSRYALRILRRSELATEASQDCFLKLHANIHRYQTGQPALPWFFVIVHRTCLDVLRRDRKFAQHPEQQPGGADGESSVGFDGNVDFERIVGGLSSESQDLLQSRLVQEQSFQEISEQSGRKESALRKAYSRLIAKIRVELGIQAIDGSKGKSND
jgi:RNA polymerase sigma-70 factor (ECF subfamily)